MNKNLSVWQLGGFTFAVALGTLLHFIIDWTGLTIFAPIAAVNESTFEHMKILFFPMLIFAFIECRFFKAEEFWWIKLIGTATGVLLIPILFYTYTGAFGTAPGWLNVVFFFISAGSGYLLGGRYSKSGLSCACPISPWHSF